MATASHAAAATVAEPAARPRPRVRRRSSRARARGGILWIAIGGILLAGVVFVNVAVLRLNLALDSSTSERTKLRAENAALQSQLSSELASSQIQTRAARELGLVYVDPGQYRYVNLAKK